MRLCSVRIERVIASDEGFLDPKAGVHCPNTKNERNIAGNKPQRIPIVIRIAVD